MRKFILIALFGLLTSIQTYSQITTNEITYVESIELENSNKWEVGAGVSNFIMHGDLRSIGTGDDTNYWNFGGYVYVDKMFNPLLGLELKLSYNEISGGAQYFSNVYEVLYVPNTVIRDNMRFEGRAYGAEINLILSFTNLYQRRAIKWHSAGYFGFGYHQYDSQLFQKNAGAPDTPLVDFGKNLARNSVNEASSIYLSTQFGLKRKITERIDLELRTGMYFNYEDHLDATISNKQDWETFFVSSLGLVLKLGKNKTYTIWGGENDDARTKFKIKDADGDGVIDELDIEPNTPKGAMVYGNGKAIDSDGDGLLDYLDQCPFVYGPKENSGCPIGIDTDGDGIMDDKDLCPTKAGPKENNGCPETVVEEKISPTNVVKNISLLATSIYFETNSDRIQLVSYSTLDKIAALMKRIPEVNFTLDGHTDSRNSDKYNLYLSQRRSASVKTYLIKAGIKNTRLIANGYGESRPKYSNTTAGGRQLNRRVEINPTNDFEKEVINIDNSVKTHTVEYNETLFSIAKRYSITVEKLKKLNNLTSNLITIGQVLKVK